MHIDWLPTVLRQRVQKHASWFTKTARKRAVERSSFSGLETLEDRALLTGLPPVALPDLYLTTEDSPVVVPAATGVLSNDVDPELDPLTAVLDFGPVNGTLLFNADGSFTYTPDSNFFGDDTFIYHANDGTGNSAPTLVTLTVGSINDAPPVALPDAYAATEDTVLTVNAANGVLVNDTDVDNDALTAILDVAPVNGNLVLNADGSFTYTPNANFNGVDVFTYHANDGTANSPPTIVTLTLASVNDAPPVSLPDLYAASEDTVLTVNAANGVLVNDVDVDGDTLTAVLDIGALNGSVVLNADGSFTYTPNANFNGIDTFVYHAFDGTSNGAPSVVTLTIAGVNDAPPVALPDIYTISEDGVLTVSAANGVLVNDTDVDGDPLTAIQDIGPLNGSLTLNADGSFTYTPNANFNGVDTFTYHANDGTANSPPIVVTLTVVSVNDAPPVALPDAYAASEDTVLTVNAANGVLANDTDVDGDTLTAVLDIAPLNGTLVLNANGSFTYTPNGNFNGVDTFVYHANDGTSNSAPTVVTLTIAGVNDAPPVAVPDAYTVSEDAVLTVSAANGVLVNDTDIDGDPLTAIQDIGPLNGSLTLNADGSFTYTPNANFNGVDTFTYHANDGTANSPPTVVTLTIVSVNDAPPVALPDAYAASEDTVLTVNAANGVLANDTDVDGDTLTAILDIAPLNGTLVLNANGSFTYTPNGNFNGVDTFVYHANDGTSNSAPTVVTLTIAGVNDAPPVAVPDAYTVSEDAVLTVSAANGVLVNDTDVDGDSLTAIQDIGPLNGSLTLNADGSFTYTPNANFNGVDTFTYHANDGTANSPPTVVTLTIVSINDAPPVALPDAYAANEDTALTVNAANGVLANDIDVDGDTLTAILDIGPVNGLVVLNADGSFTYTPNGNFNGVDTFVYHANDGTSNSPPTVVTLTIAGINDAPPVAVPDAYTATEDTVLTVSAANGVLVNDTDIDGDPLTAILDVGPVNGSLTLNADGSFTYTPNANFNGVDTFTYHANDGTANSPPTVVTLTLVSVNDAPPVALPDAYAANEDTVLTVNAANGVLANDTDVDGDPLTAILDVGPVNGSLVLNANGSFTYTPNGNFNGVDTFIYHANDGTANSAPTVVTLTIASINDAPPVAVPDAYTVSEDTVLTVSAANGVLVNDTDIDGDPLTAILDVGPVNGSLTLNANGSFTYTPNANFNGVDTFTYHANDGTANSPPTVVTLTIVSINDAPPVALPDAYAANEDTVLTVNAANGVLANDTDVDGNPLTAILDIGPLNGSVVLNPNGSFTYTPNANFNGVDTFVYHANDGTSNSPPTVVTLTVAGINDAPPVAVPDAYTVSEDTALTVNAANGVLVNDTDIDGDPLTAILDVGPLNGSLTLNANGSFTYTPNANFNGIDTFTYHANDGTANSPPTVVTLTIASVNDAPPVALPDAYATNEDTVLTVNAASGVLANDTDVDGNTLTAILDVGPLHGSLVLNANGSFTYTPASNFNGIDTFIYHANDGTSNSAPTVVTLTVNNVNDGPPVAVADTYTTAEGSTLAVFAPNGVLANDTDPDGDTLTAVLETGPTNGTLLLNPDGSFVYTPTANFSGTDSFTYHANDGTSSSNAVTVTLAVTNANDAPISQNDVYFINEDDVLTVNSAGGVLANDTDPDGDTLTVALVTAPTNGTVVLNPDGSFVYTPNDDFDGTDTFTYRANDGTTNGNLATVTINVNAQNEAPIVVTSPGVTAAKGHKKTVIDPAINLIDPDSPSFNTGSLDAAISAGRGKKDSLGYRHGGANKGRVNAKHGNLRIGKTVIGSITGGKKGAPLHVEFNSNATQERVEVVMQNLIFRGTTSQKGPRVISWKVSDNTGLESNIATKSADVT